MSVDCDGVSKPTTGPVTVTIRSGASTTCTYTDTFTPEGSISIQKITQGGTGTAAFLISALSGPPVEFLQHATTTATGIAANAVPDTADDATDHLLLGDYTVIEQSPPSGPNGEWVLTSVLCNGIAVPCRHDRNLADDPAPNMRCVFTDLLTTPPTPPPPRHRAAQAPGAATDL